MKEEENQFPTNMTRDTRIYVKRSSNFLFFFLKLLKSVADIEILEQHCSVRGKSAKLENKDKSSVEHIESCLYVE